jgi:hypothetical protein
LASEWVNSIGASCLFGVDLRSSGVDLRQISSGFLRASAVNKNSQSSFAYNEQQ